MSELQSSFALPLCITGGLLSSFALHRIHKATYVLSELASLVLASAERGNVQGHQTLIEWLGFATSSLSMSEGMTNSTDR